MADSLREKSRQLALLNNYKMSSQELKAIIVKNASIVSGLPSTQSGVIEGQKLLGEVDACQQMCAHQDEIKKLKREWTDSVQERSARALAALPAAVSYNGQLVASILEEENGLTADAIACFTDELAAMDDEAFAKLLSDLCCEGIIEKRNDEASDTERYYLRMPLLKDGTWTVEYLQKYYDSLPKRSMPFKAGNMLAVFALLKRSKEPLSAEELMQRINNGEPSDIDDDFNRPVTSDSDLMLDKLEESGLIMKAFMSSGVPDWNSVFKYFAYSEGYGMPIQFYAPACLGERDEQ